jgi:beta-glucosidase
MQTLERGISRWKATQVTGLGLSSHASSSSSRETDDSARLCRNNLLAWHNGDALVAAVAAANARTIVVIHSVGPIIMESFVNLPGVMAVVWAGLPGQESGNALVDVLYGSTSPSGKLPYTIAKTEQDYGIRPVSGDDNFPEGLFIDYRRFDANNITPRFEFGFGLCM